MINQHKFYVVEASCLPQILIKVFTAKSLLASGKVRTISAAVDKCGISRSAFYKYKDAISPFYEMSNAKIITFHSMLEDAPGVLSTLLSQLAKCGANILTINQSIPINNQAALTISARMDKINMKMDKFLERIREIEGISKFEILAMENK